jgi:hypothetical protein
MGLAQSSGIYGFIANFSFLLRIRSFEPFLNAANRAHINSHSVGLSSTRTMIPHSRGYWAQGRGIHLFETACCSHVGPRSPPNLGSGGSEASIRGFEALLERIS